jgi:membrane protein implicated in regulation of membrane protease activity
VNVARRLTILFWVLVLAYLGFYAYFLVMGVSPGEVAVFTVVAVVLVVLFAAHLRRQRRTMREHGHEDELRDVHRYRERRGF